MSSTEIVISYRSEDSGSANWVYGTLERTFGAEAIFMDRARLTGGVDFPEAITTAIRECKVVVALITPVNWSAGIDDEDDWVRRELTEALAAGKQVMPIRLHGAPPLGAGLPADLAALAKKQARSIDDEDFQSDFQRVIDDLRKLVAKPPPETAFPELDKQGRIEQREAWSSTLPEAEAKLAVERALGANRVKPTGADEEGRTLLVGGNPVWFRVMGAFFTKREAMPLKGFLRVGTGSFASIELLLAEDIRGGSVIGIGDRYELHLDRVFDAVKAATGVYV